MDIGKNIGAQTSKVVVNLDAHAALRQSVNVLRKIEVDASMFNGGHDGGGWWLDGVKQDPNDYKKYVDNSEPFVVLPDYRNPGTYASSSKYVYIMVRDGAWQRVTGGLPGSELWIDETYSDQFEKKHDYPYDPSYPSYAHWFCTTDTYKLENNNTYWFYVQLCEVVTGDVVINGLNPSKLVLKYWKEEITGNPLYDDNSSNKLNAIRILARVQITGGVISIWQYHLHNIKDNQTTADSVASDGNAYCKTLSYVPLQDTLIDGANLVATYTIQDYKADEIMRREDNIVEFDTDLALPYYQIGISEGEKNVEKKYCRIDTHDAYLQEDSGYSLEVGHANGSSNVYAQIYHFYEPSNTADITICHNFDDIHNSNEKGHLLVMARRVDDALQPRVHYLDMANVASNVCADYYSDSDKSIVAGGTIEILTFPTKRTSSSHITLVGGDSIAAIDKKGLYEIHGRAVLEGSSCVASYSGTVEFGLYSVTIPAGTLTTYIPPSIDNIFRHTILQSMPTDPPTPLPDVVIENRHITMTVNHILRNAGNSFADTDFDLRPYDAAVDSGGVGMYLRNNTGQTIKCTDCEIVIIKVADHEG